MYAEMFIFVLVQSYLTCMHCLKHWSNKTKFFFFTLTQLFVAVEYKQLYVIYLRFIYLLLVV